jgi:hypothetical protein
MTIYIRKCPGCKEERPETESLCLKCSWDLTQEPVCFMGQNDSVSEIVSLSPNIRMCLNGHYLEDGDEMCFVQDCGAGVAETISTEEIHQQHVTVIDGWIVIDSGEGSSDFFENFIVERHGHKALLTYYCPDNQPDLSVYEALNRMPKEYAPELLAHGEWNGRRYEVIDLVSVLNLLDLMLDPIDLETIRQIVKSMGRILSSLSENGLRHGNLRPENILITNRDSFGFLLTGFQYSSLSTFELDIVTQPISARYTAPEVIAGGVSVASDWWSLGMTLLQLLTKGQCFDGTNEKAFRIHVVTRGVSIPKGIDPSISLLLRGLLARDPDQRWQWEKVQKWLGGEDDAPSDIESEESSSGPALEFKGRSYVCPKAYALAAAEASNWEEAKDLFMRGVVATWLEDRKTTPKIITGVRVAASIDVIPSDFRHALALMWMNSNLPLTYQGEIVTSSWLLQNAVLGYEIITSPLIGHLRQMHRDLHLCELHDRMERARERAEVRKIELDEERFRIYALSLSRQNLERQWEVQRRLFPGSDHDGLNAFMDRQKITDEELIILLGARLDQYESAEQILTQASTIASQAALTTFNKAAAEKWLAVSRREIYREIEERIVNYSQCGIARVDEWASGFRIQRRMSLPRALALLSVSKDSWREPDRLEYVSRLLEFFEKRTVSMAQRGSLVRMSISKTGAQIDLASVHGNKPNSSSILEHLIKRENSPIGIDRLAFNDNLDLEKRLRHLVSHAKTYRRDTGIDSLYLGFPFLVMRDSHPDEARKKPKISPILLWPIKIDIESRDNVTIHFDTEREEVRLNPALARLVGAEEIKVWEEVVVELLGRSSIRAMDVIDAFGTLAEPRERALCALPNKDYEVDVGKRQVVCSAVFFHAKFMGQALVEDIRQMQKETPTGTGLESVLRVNKEPVVVPALPLIPEKDRYFTMASDPSQEKAVFRARQFPGLLIEGPPGTGKSQTIVNIIGDCIGRNETVLVVCQKAAALEVLVKRLEAEGLRDRFFYITNINKDRTSVLQSIRTQIDEIPQSRMAYRSKNIERERDEIAEKIENLENEIDKHHGAIHEKDNTTGLSYRDLLGELINIEDHESKLIDVPALRRMLGECYQRQLSVFEEACAPISAMWLESSYEGSALANLRTFSSDAALVDEFIASLFAFIEKENERNEIINLQSTLSFDVVDPSPHQEWINENDKLLKEVNWKHVSYWFQLFSSNERLSGAEIIENLEGLVGCIGVLDINKHNQKLSSKLIDISIPVIQEWLLLAEQTGAFKPESYIQHDSLKQQLEDVKQHLSSLELSNHNQHISYKLTDIPTSTLEEWLSSAEIVAGFNPLCFIQNDSFKRELEELGKNLSSLELNKHDQLLSNKLIDISTPMIEEGLFLAERSSVFKPICFVEYESLKNQLDDIKKHLSTLELDKHDPNISIKLIDVSISTIEVWLTMVKSTSAFNPSCFNKYNSFQEKLRNIKEQLISLESSYQDETFSKKLVGIPMFTLNRWLLLAKKVAGSQSHFRIFNPLRMIRLYRIKKILSRFNEDPDLDVVSQFIAMTELEKKQRPIREAVISLLKNVYRKDYLENKILIPLFLSDLNVSVERMLGDLTVFIRLHEILSGIGEHLTVEGVNKLLCSSELEIELRPHRGAALNLLKLLYQEVRPSEVLCLEGLCNLVESMRADFSNIAKIQETLLHLEAGQTHERVSQFKSACELEIQLRPIRESTVSLLMQLYREGNKPEILCLQDLCNFVKRMLEDLSHVSRMQHVLLNLDVNQTYEMASQFKNAAELETQIRPIRATVLNLLVQLYRQTEQPKALCLEDLRVIVQRMISELTYIAKQKEVLLGFGADQTFESSGQFKNAADLEREMRPIRVEIIRFLEMLYPENEISKPVFLKDLIFVADRMLKDLLLAQKGIVALLSCPRQEERVQSIAKVGLPAYLDFVSRYEEAFSRYQARVNCLDSLDRLAAFFTDELFNACQANIHCNRSNLPKLLPITKSLTSLAAYQEFRLQVTNLSPDVLKIFAILREKDEALRSYAKNALGGVIRRIIAREARLAWKVRIEQKFPILRVAQKELSRKIKILDESSKKIQELNQKFLAFNMDLNKVIGTSEEWEGITRLRGPRSKKLREFMEGGCDIGLMQLRPIWLMNPDTASQLLPLRAGMFDVIIYDEASQIPIENALPTLYRAKRVVISGDEKQMPPTSVFMKRFNDDEDYDSDDDEDSDEMSDAERKALEDTWNRREIKDCSDLLALGKTVLPKSMLQIHYRSRYRELIAFSNAAYYGNNLSVPVRHPVSVIRNIRPIEVDRVDGVYAAQTNQKEAERVVNLLAERWLSPDRPTIGVVTFNAKQADLIEDILQERAEIDAVFRQALSEERDRHHGGEDMSFFVKNVENVQGDERDVIIFSTTFGRDKKGSFKKQFGLLSRAGGEHRLNVAITRAREKIIIVTSLPINEISDALSKRQELKKSRDFLQAYLDYATKISDGSLDAACNSLERMSEKLIDQVSSNFDVDGFIGSVAAFIKSLGLVPLAIRENDAFGLDFVIEDPQKKQFGIGIECDAHCHPVLTTARAREVWRPKVLGMAIPTVHRVASYEWYHRRVEEMERLKYAIEDALGVLLTDEVISSSEG